MAHLAKAAWAPPRRSSSGVCCWLFSKSIKATSEILLVSLGNFHLAGFCSIPSRVYPFSVFFFPQILLFSIMFRQEREIFASCLYSEASSKNTIQLLHSAASGTDLLIIITVTLASNYQAQLQNMNLRSYPQAKNDMNDSMNNI